MSNTPLKTAEEILDSIPDDPNQDGVCYTLNETLAAVYAYHAQFEGRGEGVRACLELVRNIYPVSKQTPEVSHLIGELEKYVFNLAPLPSTKGQDVDEIIEYDGEENHASYKGPTLQEQAREYVVTKIDGKYPGPVQAYLAGHASRNEEVDQLKREVATMKAQINAYKTLQETGDKIRAHQSKLIMESKTVDSEREANEMLTKEVDLLERREVAWSQKVKQLEDEIEQLESSLNLLKEVTIVELREQIKELEGKLQEK